MLAGHGLGAPGEALAALAAAVPELARPGLHVSRATDSPHTAGPGDDTFVTTNSKTSLTACLDPQDAELIRAVTAASLAAAQTVVPGKVAAKAAAWLAGDHLYRLQASPPPPAVPSPIGQNPGVRSRCATSAGTQSRYGICWSATPNSPGS
jgi:hypothetical protein